MSHRGPDYADEPWFKLQRRIFRSSVWEEDPATKVVWITLIGLAQLPENRKHGHGVVLITRGNLCREAFVTAEQLDHALARLTAPDPSSRTEPGEGRIDILPNGYRLRSFELYHDAEEYEAWHAQRVAAGKARAERARRSAEASGKGGRGRFTSDEPATAGNEPATSLVSTRMTETLTLTNGHPPTPLKGNGGDDGSTKGNDNGSGKGPGAATAKELARLEADPELAAVADTWAEAFRRPGRQLGVLRAARTAFAGGYAADAIKLVVRVVAQACRAPERFPDRGSIRWAVEHDKAGDPSYLLRPATLDKLIPEAEAWDRA
jgi:hypothetical protein